MVELLKAAAAPAAGRCASAHHDQRRTGEHRLRHRADAVRDARPGREDGQARRPRQLADGLRCEHRTWLVPDVDDRHRWFGDDGSVVKREDVCAGQGEHRRGAVCAGNVERLNSTV